jgi:hypothetical protein
MKNTQSAAHAPVTPGTVLCYSASHGYNPRSHECVTRRLAAARVAALKGYAFGGEYDGASRYVGDIYFVPSNTLVGCDKAAALGIHGADHLFGGVVPYPFVGTKTITHVLASENAHAPEGWSHEFSAAVREAVLEGYAAFTAADAMRAGVSLLRRGALRVKQALALGGHGQCVVNSVPELESAIAEVDPGELSQCGVVLEQNLTDVTTYSVGQVRVADLVVSYYGTQLLTRDNNGAEVYGGSDLVVARGDFEALLALDMPPALRHAVAQAQVYDEAAHAHFPGFFASRRNYDVAQGRNADNELCCGVLEQSWRIGGASGAEIAALERFRADPSVNVIHSCCIEVYGECEPPPEHAITYFRGVDEKVGLITKYTLVDAHERA